MDKRQFNEFREWVAAGVRMGADDPVRFLRYFREGGKRFGRVSLDLYGLLPVAGVRAFKEGTQEHRP